MKEISFENLRQIQLDILEFLAGFCKTHNIAFYLCNGSLLGAVKYNGFIPWDDDIDVFLLREDYKRLILMFGAENSNSKYELMAYETHAEYAFPFAKLIDTGTKLIEKNVADIGLGVNIDIFPIDYIGNNQNELSRKFRKMNRLRRKLNWAKLSDYTASNPLKSVLKYIISKRYKAFGARRYCKKIIEIATAQTSETKYLGNYVWGFYGVGEALPRECFADSVEVSFEGKKYLAPVGYDMYLSGLYGNYHEDPPREKQKTHHSFKAFYKEESR